MKGFLKASVLLLVGLGVVGGAFYTGRQFAPSAGATATAAKVKYHCPMHPTYVSDRPGDCPICGMSLVKIDDAKAGGEHAAAGPAAPAVPGRIPIFVSPDRQQQIGVTTAPVEKRPLERSIRTVARVAYAEPRLSWVNTKVNGWIEKLHVNTTGGFVKKGEPLLEIYSPELVSAQEEYLIALRARQQVSGDDGANLLAAAKRRLQLWDIGDDQIAALEKTGQPHKTLTIVSPVDGYVVEKAALQGKAVMPGENLFRVADLSTVWLLADIYEYELSAVKVGQPATVMLSYLPGEKLNAKVGYIYPYLEGQTRTVKVRLEAPNPALKLKPDMWANVELQVESGDVLTVAASAVIDTGGRYVAFVSKGDGHLEPRELKVGRRNDDYFEVLGGVSAGEKVVTRALFLVDSESQLKAAISGMGSAGEHQHGAAPASSLADALNYYVTIQSALAADSLNGVREAAESISKLMPGPIGAQAAALATAQDIAAARERFKLLSASVIQLVDRENLQTGRYFEAHCDMAKAGWLQEGQKLRNPYFGKSMLDCGAIRKAR
ncbi:MAG: efflux RND transporter periplasmic adaptor subunit [Verrucomicrobia bacterium]|nr:efflux RND transporter periplasmic adaptor subunit [Verrucomicrobiota bacterium]